MVPSQLAAHHLNVPWKLLGDLVPSKKGKVSRCCPKRTLSSLCLLVGQHRLELLRANVRVEGVTEPLSKTYLLPTSRCSPRQLLSPSHVLGMPTQLKPGEVLQVSEPQPALHGALRRNRLAREDQGSNPTVL